MKPLLETPRKMYVVDLNRPLRQIELLEGVLKVTEKSIIFEPKGDKVKKCNVGASAFSTLEQAQHRKVILLQNGLWVYDLAIKQFMDTDEATKKKKQLTNYRTTGNFHETSETAAFFSGGKRNV